MAAGTPDRPPLARGPRGVAYVALGCVFVGLGALGAVLPVMPTTPFLLVASFFFVRSSPRLNRRLARSPLFGPFLRDWQQHRGVRPRVKVLAVAVLAVVVGASVARGNLAWPLVALLLALAAVGLAVVLRLPTIRDAPPGAADVGFDGTPAHGGRENRARG
jgi:uncharacterized membrane protein YbaN (DUF454 family)